MNKRRQIVVAFGACALAQPVGLLAQQKQAKIHRIGLLGAETPEIQADRVEALRSGLRDLGYVEGKNIVIEQRWAGGNYDRLFGLALELAQLKPDVLVTFGQKAAIAGKGATTTVPIVVPASTDAVRTGLAATLSHPGGNITGSSFFGPELIVKRLELLKEIVPRIARAGVLLNPADTGDLVSREALNAAAKLLKLSVRSFEVRAATDFVGTFAAMVKERIEAVVVSTDTLFSTNHKAIGNLALMNRLPSVSGFKEFVEAGGLISYGVNLLGIYRHAAVFVDKILRGAKPGDIPFEQPTRFEMVVNMKTAKTLGIKIPNSILVRTTTVIE
jgi:putative ABC transport system substrate-binding protein